MQTTIVTLTRGNLVIWRAEQRTFICGRDSSNTSQRVYGGEARILKSGKLGAIKGASDSGYSLIHRAYRVWVAQGQPATFTYDEDAA